MGTKCGMIAMVLLESLQVQVRGAESRWQPPFTNGLHQLERMSMAAGFFVQVAFHLVSNEIIESVLCLDFRIEFWLQFHSVHQKNGNDSCRSLWLCTSPYQLRV